MTNGVRNSAGSPCLAESAAGWVCRDKVLRTGDRPLIIGILNVTPDSFSDGGLYADPARAVERALEMAAEGADIIDVGGASSRPGAGAVPEEEEYRRVIPVIRTLRNSSATLPISGGYPPSCRGAGRA